MKWLTNTIDPRENFLMSHAERERQSRWLKDKVIGPPQATEAYSVEELQRIGMVGVYSHE